MAKKLNVYISFDLEGISGVTSWRSAEEPANVPRVRHIATAEVNAAIRGIRSAGLPVGEILICDAHSFGDTLLIEELEPGVQLVKGAPRNLYMVEGINQSFSAAFFIGYHTMVGTTASFMDHTYSSSSIYNVRINGQAVGETEINAALCGHFGVPLALVSGDDQLAREVRSFFGPAVQTVVTKYGISRFAGRCRHPEDVYGEIETKAERAIRGLGRLRPFLFRAPIRAEIDVMNTLIGHVISQIPGLHRTGGRSFRFRARNAIDFYRMLMAVCDLAGYANRSFN